MNNNRNSNWSYPRNQMLTPKDIFFGEFSNRQTLSQYSESSVMTDYQTCSTFHRSQNSLVLPDNTFLTNISQDSSYTQQKYDRRSRNSNRLNFSFAYL